MKKYMIGIIVLWGSCCGVLYAGYGEHLVSDCNWNGYYLGANAGYGWSHKDINTVGTPIYTNPLFPAGSSAISNALAAIGTNDLSKHISGFIGGIQVGYNHHVNDEKIVVGIDADIDGFAHSQSSSTVSRIVPVGTFPETYSSTLNLKRSINWLGTVRGKLGVLWNPSLLVYLTGGLAYGEVSLKQRFTANESLGPISYPAVNAHKSWNKARIGWAVGAGMEWLFRSQWSAKLEYLYYNLGTPNTNMTLDQINNLGVSPVLWGSANVNASTKFAADAIRIGVNYHFA